MTENDCMLFYSLWSLEETRTFHWADMQRGGGGGGGGGGRTPPNKPTQNMNLIIVEQIAMYMYRLIGGRSTNTSID